MAIEPCQEHDAGLVEACRRAEDVPGERHSRREDLAKACAIVYRECRQRRRRGRRPAADTRTADRSPRPTIVAASTLIS
jgi:hypothetical protein